MCGLWTDADSTFEIEGNTNMVVVQIAVTDALMNIAITL